MALGLPVIIVTLPVAASVNLTRNLNCARARAPAAASHLVTATRVMRRGPRVRPVFGAARTTVTISSSKATQSSFSLVFHRRCHGCVGWSELRLLREFQGARELEIDVVGKG